MAGPGPTPVFDDEQSRVVRGPGPGDGLGRAGRPVGADRRAGRFDASTRVASAGVNPAGKLTSIIAGMAAGADCIDDLDVIRSGGMTRLFGGVYAPATLGQFLREFTHGHTLQLASVLRAHLVNLVEHTGLLPGIERAGVHRHRLAAAAGVRARQAGRQLRAHQDRRQAGAAQGPVAAGDHDQHRAGGAGDRRDPAARRQGRLRARARRRWSPTRSAPPARPARPARSWSAATPPTATAPSSRACLRGRGPVLPGAGQEPRGRPGRSRGIPTTPGRRCTTPARCSTRTPAS